MAINLNQKSVEKELEIIFQSSQFKNCEKEIKLLEYLVNKTLAKEYIKEAHIAIDIFNKDNNFDPSLDSTVRVYIGKVRKKLETFYLSDESKEAKVKLTIPRGHYKVEFGRRIKKEKLNRLKLTSRLFILLTIILSIAFLVHLVTERNNLLSKSKKVSNSPVWKEYSDSELPTLIVIGDFFFMHKRIDNKRFLIRDYKINSIEEFYANSLDTMGFIETRRTYTSPDIPECIANFVPHLTSNNTVFQIKRASRLTMDDINNNNIIFIGEFKTLYILNRLLPRFNIDYNIENRTYSLLDDENNPVEQFMYVSDIEGNRFENLIVTKRPGGENNTITLLLSHGRGGFDDVTKKLLNPVFLREFLKKYGEKNKKDPFYFDLVFEIEGIENNTFTSKIVYFNKIDF